MKNVCILGSTGSIGKNALRVVQSHPDLFRVCSLTTNKNTKELSKQIECFRPSKVVICDKQAYDDFTDNKSYLSPAILYGNDGLLEVAMEDEVDLIINALVGFVGLLPTIEGIKHKKDIALANKESIVVGGSLVIDMARSYGVNIIPIDSEHNALLFLLRDKKREDVKKLIITASGGPFRDMPSEDFGNITVKQALKHPTWKMGLKITVDSATLLNKGFEVIEASYLFDFSLDDIEVIIHKESIVHSMIETIDGEIYAKLGTPDMRFPIQNAMTYPDIVENNYDRIKLWDVGTLSFAHPDFAKFPLLKLSYEIGSKGGTALAVLNASNEVAVYAFLENRIAYTDIFHLVSKCTKSHHNKQSASLDDIIEADSWARDYSEGLIKEKSF